jgi:lipoprotein-releasing system ATP-binding protein
MSEPLLRAEDIHKSFKTDARTLEVLKGVDLEVSEGEMAGIFGPSGSGKSTLLHILGSLDRPTRGRVRLDGVHFEDLKDRELSRFRNERIGFVFQFYHLLRELTARENVMIPALISGASMTEATDRALEGLRAVGLEERASHRPNELSGGEIQRVAIARALSNRPRIVLADEPTGNLDKETSRGLIRLFRDLNAELGVSFLLVSHDVSLLEGFTSGYRLEDGRLRRYEP